MKIVLYIPGLFTNINDIRAEDINDLRLSGLTRLLTRSVRQQGSAVRYESWLYGQFAGEMVSSEQIPFASLTAIADGLKVRDQYWMRADPVYLYPDTHSLVLQDPTKLNLQYAEIERIRGVITPLLEDYSAVLHTPNPQRWYLEFPDDIPEISCTPLPDALMKPVNQYLPSGRDYRRWHTLFNEIQMVLATLDINQWRQERQMIPINSLWFWGNGYLPRLKPTGYDCCIGDGELLRALCLSSNSRYKPLGEGLKASRYQNRSLMVYEQLWHASKLNRPELWLSALKACEEQLISPLIEQLSSGDIHEIQLISDSGCGYLSQRKHIRSFWKRMKPLSGMLLS